MMIVEKTGWSYDYVLWGTSWLNIRLMLADASKLKKQDKPMTGAELARILGIS